MEKRATTRVVFKVNSLIKYDDKEVESEIINISLQGMFFRTKKIIPEGTNIKATIVMEGTTSQLTINIQGDVVRSDGSGTAVQFKGIDIDSFLHLKNIVAYNSGDEDRVMREFYETLKKREEED